MGSNISLLPIPLHPVPLKGLYLQLFVTSFAKFVPHFKEIGQKSNRYRIQTYCMNKWKESLKVF